MLWRGACLLEGREAEPGMIPAAAEEDGVGEVRVAVGWVVNGLWLYDCTGTGMRLGVARTAGGCRGEAKLAGSRGGVKVLALGEPGWETRSDERAAPDARGVPPVNRAEGAVIRRPELA